MLKGSGRSVRRGMGRGARLLNGSTYHDEVVRITELVGDEGILESFEFTNCHIKGPAVLVVQGESRFVNNDLRGDWDAILWEIPPSRSEVIGAILVKDSTFEGCTFTNVGLAGPPEFVKRMRESENIGVGHAGNPA
jgi:hypothetical protein